tara:strand:+ start:121 stop:333 length:213 start_codon:yes stop_codon:yes gene_type:complete
LVLVEQRHLVHPEGMDHKAAVLLLLSLVEHRLYQMEVDLVVDITDLVVQADLVAVELMQLLLLPRMRDLL